MRPSGRQERGCSTVTDAAADTGSGEYDPSGGEAGAKSREAGADVRSRGEDGGVERGEENGE